MSKELKLYRVFELDGDSYLIPKDSYSSFEKALTRVEESYDAHFDEDVYYDELEELLDYFSSKRLEGEEHYIVLAKDLGESV